MRHLYHVVLVMTDSGCSSCVIICAIRAIRVREKQLSFRQGYRHRSIYFTPTCHSHAWIEAHEQDHVPHHFAPSTRTAPFPANLRCKRPSAIRFLYSFSMLSYFNWVQRYKKKIKIRHLAEFYSPVWPNFVPAFGRVLFRHLAEFCSAVWPYFIRVFG